MHEELATTNAVTDAIVVVVAVVVVVVVVVVTVVDAAGPVLLALVARDSDVVRYHNVIR